MREGTLCPSHTHRTPESSSPPTSPPVLPPPSFHAPTHDGATFLPLAAVVLLTSAQPQSLRTLKPSPPHMGPLRERTANPHPRPRPRSSTPGLRLRAYALKRRPPPRILRIQPPCSRPRSRADSIPSRQHRLGCGWRRLDVSTSPDVARGSSSPTRTLNSVGVTFQARGRRKGVVDDVEGWRATPEATSQPEGVGDASDIMLEVPQGQQAPNSIVISCITHLAARRQHQHEEQRPARAGTRLGPSEGVLQPGHALGARRRPRVAGGKRRCPMKVSMRREGSKRALVLTYTFPDDTEMEGRGRRRRG